MPRAKKPQSGIELLVPGWQAMTDAEIQAALVAALRRPKPDPPPVSRPDPARPVWDRFPAGFWKDAAAIDAAVAVVNPRPGYLAGGRWDTRVTVTAGPGTALGSR